jgi:hypothetical protein
VRGPRAAASALSDEDVASKTNPKDRGEAECHPDGEAALSAVAILSRVHEAAAPALFPALPFLDPPVERRGEGTEFNWNHGVRSLVVVSGAWRVYQHRGHNDHDDTPKHFAVGEAHRWRHRPGAAVVSSAAEAEAERELVAELIRVVASRLARVVGDVEWSAAAAAARLTGVLGKLLIEGRGGREKVWNSRRSAATSGALPFV